MSMDKGLLQPFWLKKGTSGTVLLCIIGPTAENRRDVADVGCSRALLDPCAHCGKQLGLRSLSGWCTGEGRGKGLSKNKALKLLISQTEMYPSGNAIRAFVQTPAPVLDKISGPMDARFLSSTGPGSGNLIGRAQFPPASPLDKKSVSQLSRSTAGKPASGPKLRSKMSQFGDHSTAFLREESAKLAWNGRGPMAFQQAQIEKLQVLVHP